LNFREVIFNGTGKLWLKYLKVFLTYCKENVFKMPAGRHIDFFEMQTCTEALKNCGWMPLVGVTNDSCKSNLGHLHKFSWLPETLNPGHFKHKALWSPKHALVTSDPVPKCLETLNSVIGTLRPIIG